jgi:hypothetical protein
VVVSMDRNNGEIIFAREIGRPEVEDKAVVHAGGGYRLRMAGAGGALGVCEPPPSDFAACGVGECGLSLELVVAGPVLHAQRMTAALSARKDAAARAPRSRGMRESSRIKLVRSTGGAVNAAARARRVRDPSRGQPPSVALMNASAP